VRREISIVSPNFLNFSPGQQKIGISSGRHPVARQPWGANPVASQSSFWSGSNAGE